MLKKLLNWKVGLIVGVSTAAFIAIVASPLVAQKAVREDFAKKYSLLNHDSSKATSLSVDFKLTEDKFKELAQQLTLNNDYKNKLSAQTALELDNDNSYVFQLVQAIDFSPFKSLDPDMVFELKTTSANENSSAATTVDGNTIKNVVLTGIDSKNSIYYQSIGNIQGFGTSDGQDKGDFFIDELQSGLQVNSNIAFSEKPATLTAIALQQAFDKAYQEFKAPVISTPAAPSTPAAASKLATDSPAPTPKGADFVAQLPNKNDHSNPIARAFTAMLPNVGKLNLVDRQGNPTLLPQGYILQPKLVNGKLSFTNLDDVQKTLSLEMEIVKPDANKTIVPVELKVTNLVQVESNFENAVKTNFSKSYRIKPELAKLLNDTNVSLASIIYGDSIPKALSDYVAAEPVISSTETTPTNLTNPPAQSTTNPVETQSPITNPSAQANSSQSDGTNRSKSTNGQQKIVTPVEKKNKASDAIIQLFAGKTLADLQKFDFWYTQTGSLGQLLNSNDALPKYSDFNVDFAHDNSGALIKPSQEDIEKGKILFNFGYATTFANPVDLPNGVKLNPDRTNSVLQSANIKINGDIEALRGQLASLFGNSATLVNLEQSKYNYVFVNDLNSSFVPLAQVFNKAIQEKANASKLVADTHAQTSGTGIQQPQQQTTAGGQSQTQTGGTTSLKAGTGVSPQPPAVKQPAKPAAPAKPVESMVDQVNQAGAQFFGFLNNVGSLDASQQDKQIKRPGELVKSLIDKFVNSSLPNKSVTTSYDGNYNVILVTKKDNVAAQYVITIPGVNPTNKAWTEIRQYSPTVYFDATGTSVRIDANAQQENNLSLSDLNDKTLEWKTQGVPQHDSVNGVTLGDSSLNFDIKSEGIKYSDKATTLTNGSLFMAFSVDQLPKDTNKLYLLKSKDKPLNSTDTTDKIPSGINVFIQKMPKPDTTVATNLASVKDSYIIGLEYGEIPGVAPVPSVGIHQVTRATNTPAATIIGLFTSPVDLETAANKGTSTDNKPFVIGKTGSDVHLGDATFSQTFNGYKKMEDFLITQGETFLLEINISKKDNTTKSIEFILRSSKNNDPLNQYIKSTITFDTKNPSLTTDLGLPYLGRGIDYNTIGGRTEGSKGLFNLKGFAVFSNNGGAKDSNPLNPIVKSDIAKAFIDQYFYKFKANN